MSIPCQRMYRSIVKIEGICRPEIYLTPRQLVLFAFNTRGYTSSSSPSNTNNPPEKPVETTHSNSNSNSNAHALNNPIPSYPWLLSSSLPRIKKLTLWERLKQYHFKQVGIERTKEHLQDKVYPFPEQFQEDASKVVLELFSRLNGNRSAISQISTDTSQSDTSNDSKKEIPSSSSSMTTSDKEEITQHWLQPVMINSLADIFVRAHQEASSSHHRVEFKLFRGAIPKIKVDQISLTYGPFPPPYGYSIQHWFSFLSLVVPKEDQVFRNYPHQKEVLKRAKDDGVYLRINTTVSLPIQFSIIDNSTDVVKLQDRRNEFQMEFVSPHFTPWDEIFALQKDGSWKLKWRWRVSDIDYLLKSLRPIQDSKIQIDYTS